MKRILILPLFLFSINLLLAQDYLNEVAKEVCECVSKIEDGTNPRDIEMKFGLCMITSAKPYQKKIKKDFKIDLDNLNANDGAELGKVIGVKVAAQCPDVFMKMYNKIHEAEDMPPPPLLQPGELAQASETISGVVTKIEDGNFIVFSLKDDKGKVIKLYWMDFISSDMDLVTDYANLLEKSVEVSYTRHDYFDPKIKEYRQYFVITELKLN